MAKRRKGGIITAVVVVALLGVLGYSTLAESGSSVKVADPGGGSVPASPGPPAPYAVSTLGAVGTAPQDPGGGGGGTGAPGNIGPPAIQGPQGPGSPQGFEDSSDTLYLSGVNLLDPNRAATTSGEAEFTGLPGLGALPGAQESTGCADEPDELDYYAIPLKFQTVGFNGAPRVHLRITGSGPVTATLVEENPDETACQVLTSGTGQISGGTADFSMGARNLQFRKGWTAAVVFKAPGGEAIQTDGVNPSFVQFPNAYGL